MVNDVDRAKEARFLFMEAYRAQMEKRFETAVDLYKRSIEAHPTAEAHTFLGWTYSHLDRLEDAIEECRRAIAVDPAYGNPYNDIGSYLMKLGRPQEAIEWLEKAKEAPRYEPRHFPYLNLGRIYLGMGRFDEAQREFALAKFVFDNEVEESEPAGEEEEEETPSAVH